MSSSSSDQESSEDNGERIRNVRSLLVKSSSGARSQLDCDYVFKRKLGDLIFDANFEGGNLGLVEQVDKYTYDLMLRPDVANPRHRNWFNFKVDNFRPGQCVLFCFVNLSEEMPLFNEGLSPVVRCRLFPNWTRLHPDQAFYYRSLDHSNRRILTIAFRFSGATSTSNNEHQFALHYPYTLTSLVHFIGRWSVELRREELATKRASRRLRARSSSAAPPATCLLM